MQHLFHLTWCLWFCFFLHQEGNGNINSAFLLTPFLALFFHFIYSLRTPHIWMISDGEASQILSVILWDTWTTPGLTEAIGRNNRNRNQNRDRYRNNDNRSQGNRGSSNQGPGILGAKPGDRSVPELPSKSLARSDVIYVIDWSVNPYCGETEFYFAVMFLDSFSLCATL